MELDRKNLKTLLICNDSKVIHKHSYRAKHVKKINTHFTTPPNNSYCNVPSKPNRRNNGNNTRMESVL